MIEDRAQTAVVTNGAVELAGANHWSIRADAGYNQLGWVRNGGLQQRMVEIAALQGHETVVDAGTGSGAILDTLAPHLTNGGRIIGFDISPEMMRGREDPLPKNAQLYVADIYQTPFASSSIDLITARQVYHNLPGIARAVTESARILRPGGRLIICEYTPHDQEVHEFERPIWDKKEAGRNLWTGNQLAAEVAAAWPDPTKVGLQFGILPQYSNKDWLKKSGLPLEVQQDILADYLAAPDHIKQKMAINETSEGDILVDRPFAFVVATKPYDR